MRYIVGLLIAIGLVFIFIVIVARVIFGGGGNGGEEQTKQAALADYKDTNTVVRLITEGPIVADEDFRQVQIEVGREKNTIDVMHGYRGDVAKHESVPSNANAYGNFLRAIELYGFGSGDGDAESDYRGFCPTGNRYVYQIVEDGRVSKQYWTTSCGDEGTFRGQFDMVNQLFQQQIPNYTAITSGLNM